ncbi:MAG TPA: GTPase [Actinomycetaceae bacterium]|nr:GTPase [Actinomycetaceae bacterium]
MRTATKLEERQAALSRAVDLAEGRIEPTALLQAEAAIERLESRAGIAPDRTVVALLGATGSGKSSLFNAILGEEIAHAAPTRPTTRRPLAASWGGGAAELLDWLEIPDRVERPEDESGLILVDLPDIDSTEFSHRRIAARMADVVDVLIWVLDPQKYADAVVHQEYLRPLAANADVTMIVLNQVDRLDGAGRAQVIKDLRSLLKRDGLGRMQVLATSAKTGEGVKALRAEIDAVARSKRARLDRARGDITRAAEDLREAAEGAPDVPAEVDPDTRDRLRTSAAAAAGVPAIVDAVRASYLRRARSHVGWVPVRWLSKLRPNPMRRLHLDRTAVAAGIGRTSLPGPTLVQEAAVRSAAHDLVGTATRELPDRWRARAIQDSQSRIPVAIDGLDTNIADIDFEQSRRPLWWRFFGALQIISFLAALAGALWLGGLAVLAYMQLPQPETPMVYDFPLPTVMLVGGLVLGILLAITGMLMARAAARAAARRIGRSLTDTVTETVDELLIEPLETELEDYRLFRDSLELALRS